jgi:signal transduction histidine kinase/HAMP domain-containing protein
LTTGTEEPEGSSSPVLSAPAVPSAASVSGTLGAVTPVVARPMVPRSSRFAFRTRLTLALLASALLPLAIFCFIGVLIVLVLVQGPLDPTIARLLLFALAIVITLAIIGSYLLVEDLTSPLRGFARAVDRVSAGDLSHPIQIAGDDELAHLAESHNRLAADLLRRNQELGQILAAIEAVSPRDGVQFLAARAADDAKAAFGMIDAAVYLGNPAHIPIMDAVPGESRPLRAVLRAGGEDLGVLFGRLPATRSWERADGDLLELFASHVAVAIRNAQLFTQVEEQNAQLIELDAAKDEFLRGVSHNLQTPLTSIRAHAEQLGDDRPDRRLGIIAEQSERLSRMVRQLLTVTRLESGAFKPKADVVSLGGRVKKAWEALGADGVEFTIEDRSDGWLAIADADQLDQVLWALLDNAVKYGERRPVSVEVIAIAAEPDVSQLRVTITDGGRGVSEADRERLFGRFQRGTRPASDLAGGALEGTGLEGSGLGLYVSRELCRAMDGDLVLEPPVAGEGASFSIYLPGEAATE